MYLREKVCEFSRLQSVENQRTVYTNNANSHAEGTGETNALHPADPPQNNHLASSSKFSLKSMITSRAAWRCSMIATSMLRHHESVEIMCVCAFQTFKPTLCTHHVKHEVRLNITSCRGACRVLSNFGNAVQEDCAQPKRKTWAPCRQTSIPL